MREYGGFRRGYVRIKLQGEQTERFLNLCRAKEIRLFDVCRESDQTMTGCLLVKDFFRLMPIHRKTKVSIHILEKHGLPFFFYRSKKRKAFFLGILFCALLIFWLSGRIWNIQIEGNVRNSTPEIMGFLEESGIRHGIARKNISCAGIAMTIRENYPDIAWVSAKLEGTRLLITVKEGIFGEKEEQLTEAPCNIVADADGEIVKMITREGRPQMKVGESCKKGDLLVSGLLELHNDSQEVMAYEGVHADADIYIRRKKAYYRELPLLYETESYTGDEDKGLYLKIGRFYIGVKDRYREDWQKTVEEKFLYLTKSFRIPVSVGKITQRKFRKVKKQYTEEEAKALAWQTLQHYEEKLIQKGVQISANNVKIEVNHENCVSKGFLEIIEEIGEETPVEMPEQPVERTTEDG